MRMNTRSKPSTARRPSHNTLASMRGNLRQILAIPEESRTERQHKAVSKISGAIHHARHELLEKGRKNMARIKQLEEEALVFDNPAFTRMVLSAIASIASDEGYVHGMALRDMTENNPFMSSTALGQLEEMGHLKRLPDGAVLLNTSSLPHKRPRRRPASH